jgi:hypothetical protein
MTSLIENHLHPLDKTARPAVTATRRSRRPVPATLTADYLAERWPRLFHLTEAGAWSSIRDGGLLSTSALLDRFEITGARRAAIESARRPDAVHIEHPRHGEAWIQDNRPINETALRRTLVGMTEPEWYRELNRRVFFWLDEARLARLRNAKYHRDRGHDVLVVDTAALLEAHGDRVQLAHLNTGAVRAAANYPRGVGTFRPIEEYPWPARLRTAPREPIVELTVRDAVPDLRDLVIEVRTT